MKSLKRTFTPDILFKEQDDNILKIDELYQDKAQFLFNSCKDFLDNTVISMEQLQQKGFALLAFSFAFMSFSFFRIIDFSKYLSNPNLHTFYLKIIIILSLISVEYLCISTIVIFLVLYPKKKGVSGNEPKNIISQDNIDRAFTDLLIDEASTYHEKIEANLIINKTSSLTIKCSIIGMFFFPIITSMCVFLA